VVVTLVVFSNLTIQVTKDKGDKTPNCDFMLLNVLFDDEALQRLVKTWMHRMTRSTCT
jgi:hypothetical protein